MPEISIIVPTYNRPEMLFRALKSIASQTFRDFEVLVVNDGGVDVDEVLGKFENNITVTGVKLFRNCGLAAARNSGIRASSGRYIAYLDDDDLLYDNHLEQLYGVLCADPSKHVVYSRALRAFQKRYCSGYRTVERRLDGSTDFSLEKLLVSNITPVNCVMHKASCLEGVGLFDEDLPVMEDWDLWIRMASSFNFYHLPRVTCEFSWRTDGSTMTSSQHKVFADTARRIHNRYAAMVESNPEMIRSQKLTPLRTLDERTYRRNQNHAHAIQPRVHRSEIPGLNAGWIILDKLVSRSDMPPDLVTAYLELVPPRPFFLYQLIEIAVKRKVFSEIRPMLTEALQRMEATDYSDFVFSGLAWTLMGDNLRAAEAFERARKMNGYPKIATIKCAHAYRAIGLEVKALELLKCMARMDPDNINPKYAIAGAYYRLNRKAEGRSHMVWLEACHPNEAQDNPLKIGRHWQVMANYERAYALFKSIPHGHTDYQKSLLFRCECLLELGRISEATVLCNELPDTEAARVIRNRLNG